MTNSIKFELTATQIMNNAAAKKHNTTRNNFIFFIISYPTHT